MVVVLVVAGRSSCILFAKDHKPFTVTRSWIIKFTSLLSSLPVLHTEAVAGGKVITNLLYSNLRLKRFVLCSSWSSLLVCHHQNSTWGSKLVPGGSSAAEYYIVAPVCCSRRNIFSESCLHQRKLIIWHQQRFGILGRFVLKRLFNRSTKRMLEILPWIPFFILKCLQAGISVARPRAFLIPSEALSFLF